MKLKLVVFVLLFSVVMFELPGVAKGEDKMGVRENGPSDKALDLLGWRLGMQAYSFNRFTFFEAVEKTSALGLKWLEAYPGQRFSLEKPDSRFDHNMSEELKKQALEKLDSCGVKLVNYGVAGLPNDETECRKVFEFAKCMGIETICSEPPENAMELIENLCEEYEIDVAIHNHPKPSRYWSPDKVVKACENRSSRIGACADTGHWMRSEINPSNALRELEGRIVSFHFKDLNKFGGGAHDVPWGTGEGNVKRMLTEIHRQGVRAVFSVEYEHNWENSMPEIAQSVQYFGQVAQELASREEAQPPLLKLVVEAGEHDRYDVPVSVSLEQVPDSWRPLRLYEVVDESLVAAPSQIEEGENPRLWWLLSGKTAAGSDRKYLLKEGSPFSAEGNRLDMDDMSLKLSCRSKKVLQYNHGFVVPPPGADGRYIRSGYIHPVWSPTGLLVTEDFPSDHLHHKGIWFPWTKTEFEGRHPDFWNLKGGTGTVRFAGFESTTNGPVYGGFRVKHQHVDLTGEEPKVALEEVWDVKVWNLGSVRQGFLWDLCSVQRCATASPLRLPEYRYGGLGFRGSVDWVDENLDLLTSEGRTRKDGHATRSRWCDMSGPIGNDGGYAGMTIMTHPQNFRFPQHMRIWDKGGTFFCYSPSLGGDWSIEPGEDYVSQYRFYVHEGHRDTDSVEECWHDFAEPPTVRIMD